MGNIKKNGTINFMDDNGDLVEIYPVTKASNVTDLEAVVETVITELLDSMVAANVITDEQRTNIDSIRTGS